MLSVNYAILHVMDEQIKREIKAELKRQSLGYGRLGEKAKLTEGAIAATLSKQRPLLTQNARKIIDALGLEVTLTPKKTAATLEGE